MMSGRGSNVTPQDLLGISWHDSAVIPLLNPDNVLDYFCEHANPFYDRTCNNEVIKMQRISPANLNSMNGLEYILLHTQPPILYVIRKQMRSGPDPRQATPIADYYIIDGKIFQAPDLRSLINSRMLATVHTLQSAIEDVFNATKYHPSKGYSWNSKMGDGRARATPQKKTDKEEAGSNFQRLRVDRLLMELTKKFPPPSVKIEPKTNLDRAVPGKSCSSTGDSTTIKSEPDMSYQGADCSLMKAPLQKKIKVERV